MTAPAQGRERTYRFAPLDRTGLLLGLSGTQCGLVGGGVFAAGALLQARTSPALVLVPLVVAAALAFGTWEGQHLHDHIPTRLRFLIVKRTWEAPIPLLSGTRADREKQPPLPPFLAGLELIDATGIGVVRDRRHRTVTGSVPVSGREFSLVERAEQDRILTGWGEVLNGFCAERGAVCRVRVTEWAAPGGSHDLDRYLAEGSSTRSPELQTAYEDLIATAAPMAVRHHVLMSVTVDARRIRTRRRIERTEDAAVSVLIDELDLLTSRLESAGFPTAPALSVTELATALRHRLDPSVVARPTRAASLAEAAGLVSPWNAGPLATELDWSHLRADGSVHRTYWVSDWPRLDVGPNWLEPVLLHAGGVRTFALHYEPIARSRSQRRVDRDSTRLAADEEQRTRAGFRIGAHHRRAQAAVLEREAELVAGFCELEYAGFVVVTAGDVEALDRSCAEYEQVAAQSGVQLRPLEGRHDLGVVCALPVGRGLTFRWGTS